MTPVLKVSDRRIPAFLEIRSRDLGETTSVESTAAGSVYTCFSLIPKLGALSDRSFR